MPMAGIGGGTRTDLVLLSTLLHAKAEASWSASRKERAFSHRGVVYVKAPPLSSGLPHTISHS